MSSQDQRPGFQPLASQTPFQVGVSLPKGAVGDGRSAGQRRLPPRGRTRRVSAPGVSRAWVLRARPGPRVGRERARARAAQLTRRPRGRPRQRSPWPDPLRSALPHSPTPRGPRREPREPQAKNKEAQRSAGRRSARAEVHRRPRPRAAALGHAGGPRSVAPARPFCVGSLDVGSRHLPCPAVGSSPPSLPAPVLWVGWWREPVRT